MFVLRLSISVQVIEKIFGKIKEEHWEGWKKKSKKKNRKLTSRKDVYLALEINRFF